MTSLICERCRERPSTDAFCQVVGLVLRRLNYCSECMEELTTEGRRELPLGLRGSWPIDWDEVRRGIPAWLADATRSQVRHARDYIRQVAAHYGQTVPAEIDQALVRFDELA